MNLFLFRVVRKVKHPEQRIVIGWRVGFGKVKKFMVEGLTQNLINPMPQVRRNSLVSSPLASG